MFRLGETDTELYSEREGERGKEGGREKERERERGRGRRRERGEGRGCLSVPPSSLPRFSVKLGRLRGTR